MRAYPINVSTMIHTRFFIGIKMHTLIIKQINYPALIYIKRQNHYHFALLNKYKFRKYQYRYIHERNSLQSNLSSGMCMSLQKNWYIGDAQK